jgi:hypothetical protein
LLLAALVRGGGVHFLLIRNLVLQFLDLSDVGAILDELEELRGAVLVETGVLSL